jgi:hypothetical protein
MYLLIVLTLIAHQIRLESGTGQAWLVVAVYILGDYQGITIATPYFDKGNELSKWTLLNTLIVY